MIQLQGAEEGERGAMYQQRRIRMKDRQRSGNKPIHNSWDAACALASPVPASFGQSHQLAKLVASTQALVSQPLVSPINTT